MRATHRHSPSTASVRAPVTEIPYHDEERQARIAEMLAQASKHQAKAMVALPPRSRVAQLTLILERWRGEYAAIAPVAPERGRHLADAIADLEVLISRERTLRD